MNIYKIRLGLTCFLAITINTVFGQDKNLTTSFENSIEKLAAHAEQLGIDIANKVKDIDTEKISVNAEKIAKVSEKEAIKIAEKFQGVDWDNFDVQVVPGELEADANSVEKSKTIQKVYIISKNTPLSINNRYGTVDVKTWSKNEIKVDITIRAVEASGSKADEIINSVSIEETKSPNNISLTTQIDKGQSSWWNKVISSNNRGVQINYQIYLPQSNDLNVDNKYGAVILPDLKGNVNIDVGYGSLTAGKLLGNTISINSSYGSAKIAAVKDATLDFKYGSMDLGEANNVKLNVGYCGGSKIRNLISSGDISIKYSGGFNIGLDKNINRLNLDAAYSASSIRIDPSATFSYTVNVSYGGFDAGNSTVTKEDPDPDSRGPKLHKTYTGYHGKNTNSHINIDSKYGSIKFQ